MKTIALLLAATALTSATPAWADEAELQAEVAALKAQLAAQNALIAAQNARLDRLEALEQRNSSNAPAQMAANTADMTGTGGAAAPASSQPASTATASTATASTATASAATGTAASAQASMALAAASPPSDTSIGGYGEIAYNGYVHDASRNQADLKRFVLFVGHRFSDRLSFNSEVEVEHAVSSADDKGEVEIEQAWLNYAFQPAVNLKAGLFLMPFGFLNRNHEPPVFYGVERNEVETRIIPSTWREGGLSLWGETPSGIAYDLGVTTGFDVARFDDAGAPLAAAHQELQLAKAASLSYYASLEYKGVPGVLVGGAIFHGGALHSNADYRADNTLPDFSGLNSRVTLWDVHGRWQHDGFDVEALYAHGSYSHADALDTVLLAYNAANGTDRPIVPGSFYGWLVQGAYSFALGHDMSIDPFVRYEKFDTQASLPLGLVADTVKRDRIVTTGFSFHPLHEVVVKVDYQKFLENTANDRVNFGLGYMF